MTPTERTETGSPKSPADVVAGFISAVNRHDAAGLANLMTEDHRFIDSLGSTVRGREEMRKAWIAYFYLIPDYTIKGNETLSRDDTVAVFGTASGTYAVGGKLLPQNRWEVPVAFRATVRGDQVAEWQVYADNEPVRLVMALHSPQSPRPSPK